MWLFLLKMPDPSVWAKGRRVGQDKGGNEKIIQEVREIIGEQEDGSTRLYMMSVLPNKDKNNLHSICIINGKS